MNRDGIDFGELDELSKQLMRTASKKYPRETRKFLRDQGTKLKRATTKKAKQKVKKKTGFYLKGIKRGKVYKFAGQDTSVRVYNSMPHSHLIEQGHRIVGKDGSEHGFERGKFIFKQAAAEFQDEFTKNCEQFVTDLLEEGLG
ncbi:HK97 gp10 family phage protein [Paenibacillus sp. ACRRX]|uniref:HK97 gp10 family phage protein n=1 Tax=Paenibacillus sp. ACRRX TaxID=2918206 RepID=UPI001EF69D97|nr:HK97 gp10 family phage protein [Paenibacillus sp. ACRRX]MCG7410579.1 HK97 gp10 family phage protein [Paenibacillus sp. ACRRX]